MLYLIVIILLAILAYKYDFQDQSSNKEFWYRFIFVVLVLIAGLRYRVGADTINYIFRFYHEVPYLWDIKAEDLELGNDPMFLLLNSFVRSVGGRFYVVQFLQAIFVNGLIMAYIKKHSQFIFSCTFLYFIWCYFFYNFEEMRASMSLAICLYANDYILEKKWRKGVVLYLFSSLFHFSSVALLLTPLFLFLRFNFIGYVFLFLSFFIGFLIQAKFGDYLMLFDFSDEVANKAESYSNSEDQFEQKINLVGVITNRFFYILYSIVAFFYIKYKSLQGDSTILKFQPFVLLGLSFVLFSIPMPICYRYIRFYEIYFIFFFVHFFVDLVKNNLLLSKSLAFARAFVILLPFLNIISHGYRDQFGKSWSHRVYYYTRFYPYSSIFEKSTDKDREYFYRNWDIGKKKNKNEY